MSSKNFVAQTCRNTARNYKVVLSLVAIFAVSAFAVSAQQQIWSENNQARSAIVTDKAVARQSFPQNFKLYNLDIAPLRQQLLSIVGENARQQSVIISLPNADGGIEYFEVSEASNFEPELQAQFPEIRAFSGAGVTDRYATLKLSISPQGIQTMVFRTGTENEFIEPYSEDHNVYAVFRSSRQKGSLPWACSTEDKKFFSIWKSDIPVTDAPLSNTNQLKTMRLAQSCNAEYSNFFGATSAAQVDLVLAAYNATLTRANGVYEKDLAIHLNLVPESTRVIYYDPATDPYTTLGAWNNQLQAALTANVGEANYDIGHMFGASGGGGNAGCIGCVCVDGQKGRGITSPADAIPQGDNFDIDYVVHEVGHQMGANHTFSQSNEGTGVNKEVGSGITIMGYAGITSVDVAPHSIDVFHHASIQQIQVNVAPRPCPVTVNMTANSTPVVAAVPNYTIPITTPFALTGSATDPENDPLTYNWEQNDNSTTTGVNSVASPTKLTGPNWLTFPSTASPTRTFPRLATILAGRFVTGPLPGGDAVANIEALSSVPRNLNFRLTVRDNRPYVAGSTIGQTQFTDTTVTVVNTGGPFRVTVGNTAGTTFLSGADRTITWDVNGTNIAPISAANVKISLSTDGGQTFPTVLAASTANDGSESVAIPNTTSTTARIKVEAIGNIFFDINDTNITLSNIPTNPSACTVNKRRSDFNGDNVTDFSIFRPSTGTWFYLTSGSGTSAGYAFGQAGDRLVPADYDGDGKTDYAVVRNGIWYWTQSADSTFRSISWGFPTDIPVAGDFTGDGRADVTVYRPSNGVWYTLNPVNQATTAVQWGGTATDIPIVGDFDGDCRLDYAVRRTTDDPSANATQYFILRSSGGATSVRFGRSDMAMAIGDYNGDGSSDIGVVETRNGLYYWYAVTAQTNTLLVNGIQFGQTGDVVTTGDYNGDEAADLSVWRPSNGTFYYRAVSNATQFGQTFGLSTDIPTARAYQQPLP